jgi:hypothetical protein
MQEEQKVGGACAAALEEQPVEKYVIKGDGRR